MHSSSLQSRSQLRSITQNLWHFFLLQVFQVQPGFRGEISGNNHWSVSFLLSLQSNLAIRREASLLFTSSSSSSFFFYNCFCFLKYLFIYLAAPGLSCSTWDIRSYCGMWDPFPWPGVEPRALYWESAVLPTGPPGNSLVLRACGSGTVEKAWNPILCFLYILRLGLYQGLSNSF